MFVLFGEIIALVGAMLVFAYIWKGIILRIGESDQSLIFWYLPILFIGVIGIIGGIILLLLGIKHLKRKNLSKTE